MSAGDFQGTYAAEKVIVTIGPVILSGWTDGDFLTAKYDEDRYFAKAGADGEVGRAKNASKMGEITITLSQTSGSNDGLSLLFNLGSLGAFDNPIPIGIADLSGRTLAGAASCWIKTTPELSFGKEVGDREWVFTAAGLTMHAGGNS